VSSVPVPNSSARIARRQVGHAAESVTAVLATREGNAEDPVSVANHAATSAEGYPRDPGYTWIATAERLGPSAAATVAIHWLAGRDPPPTPAIPMIGVVGSTDRIVRTYAWTIVAYCAGVGPRSCVTFQLVQLTLKCFQSAGSLPISQ
jgi:hypothetical protein